jgi:hypothetical protein
MTQFTSPPRRWPFVLANVLVWLAMTVILVLVPDALDGWLGLEIARVVGWAVAGSVWVVTLEKPWQAQVGVAWRFVLQLLLWISAALVAIWISEMTRP